MYDELLRSVDNIDMDSIDAEINVLESLIDSYDKALTILENCDDTTDTSSFEIFQEGERWDKFKADTNAPIFGTKDESVAKRIAMVIPRLIAAIIRLCKKLFSKNKKVTERMEADVREMKQSLDRPVSTQQTIAPKEPVQNNPIPEPEPESVPENDKKEEPVELTAPTESLRDNAPMENTKTGDVYKVISSILFGQGENGDIDKLFIQAEWFRECEKSLSKEFDKDVTIENLQSHLNTIKNWAKGIAKAQNELGSYQYNGGGNIKIKDSEFVAKMEEFKKTNEENINSCNELISFVEEKISRLNAIQSEQEGNGEVTTVLAQILRQYSRFLKMLNTYVTTIWQAWEHDRGARDQARIVST
jgi:hypothetical protein